MGLQAGPGSTVPIELISYETDYHEEGSGELVCHVRGEGEDFDTAGVALANAGRRNLDVIAVAANAAVLAPHIEVIYEARPGGHFKAVRTLGEEPQVARRMIDVDRTLLLIQTLEKHPKETRLLRAAANYGESLRRTGPASSVHALMHLWIAVENLTVAIVDRLKREHDAATLAELGAAFGLRPTRGRDYIDDREIHGYVRRREVFAGDDSTHAALRRASDGIEHGFLSFGDARDLVADIFDTAAAAVRHSILRESGLPDSDVEALMSGIYTRPLPLWRPLLVAAGRFAEDTSFDFRRPVHLRVDADIRIERIDPNEHATFAEIDTQVHALGGLAVNVEAIALTAPGQMHPVQAED
jgi:hypothetical protein